MKRKTIEELFGEDVGAELKLETANESDKEPTEYPEEYGECCEQLDCEAPQKAPKYDIYCLTLKSRYRQLKELYASLHDFILQYEAGVIDNGLARWFAPLEIYKKQAKALGDALYLIELEAKIEKVDLRGE